MKSSSLSSLSKSGSSKFSDLASSGVTKRTSSEPVWGFLICKRLTSKFSQTMRVDTAPISKPVIVSLIPKQNLPVSCATSSKKLVISFFSWMNLTFLSVSEDNSIAWLKPF